MNHMLYIQHSSSNESSVDSIERTSFDDQRQRPVLIQEPECRCQDEPSFPCSNYFLDEKIAKDISRCHFERLSTQCSTDDPASSSTGLDSLGEPCYYEDLLEQTEGTNQVEKFFFLGLEIVDKKIDTVQLDDDSSYRSITEDSLKIVRRRMAKRKKSQMKTLSDFRRSFARQPFTDSKDAPVLQESRNTPSPPCS
eukprot:CAMPEP_0119015482 /NCGR_PEP_ID=MMETSP1176-20130426/11118_1 /TAXON_ID=265551 /ORGANISM="Synedropsis recta cf, Strain CCMP1620" /LENGTH=194 /DNA_ID=CAMNT_0006968779 /DNA_START=90 /DNA_END=674 /DNA_ORIENTATION=+